MLSWPSMLAQTPRWVAAQGSFGRPYTDRCESIKALWFERASEFAKHRGVKGWPRVEYDGPFPSDPRPKDGEAKAASAGADKNPVADAASQQADRPEDGSSLQNVKPEELSLGPCNIWLGQTDSDGPATRIDHPSEEDVLSHDGVALVYYPLVPGKKVPNPAETWSTWR